MTPDFTRFLAVQMDRVHATLRQARGALPVTLSARARGAGPPLRGRRVCPSCGGLKPRDRVQCADCVGFTWRR